MFWQRKKLKYDILIPPIYGHPIIEFSHKEADAYYQWFVSHIPDRIEYLSSAVCKGLHIPAATMDLSPESLIPLWTWFLRVAEVENTPVERLAELEKEHTKLPVSFREHIIKQSTVQLSLETEYILRDIGMYLGEAFVRNEPSIRWTYYEEPLDIHAKKPVLEGFIAKNYPASSQKMYFEPIHMAGVQAAKILSDSRVTDEKDLYSIYDLWVRNYIA